MTAREVLGGIKAEAEGLTDLCPEHLRQSIRHVQRNCDIECNEHPNGDPWCECHQPDRYDGERMAKSLGNIERLTRAVEAALDACDIVIDNRDGHKPPGPPHPTRQQATAVRIRSAIENALNP